MPADRLWPPGIIFLPPIENTMFRACFGTPVPLVSHSGFRWSSALSALARGPVGQGDDVVTAIVDQRPVKSIHLLHAVLLAATLPLFLGGLLSDIAYALSYEIQWSNFAAWLIAGAWSSPASRSCGLSSICSAPSGAEAGRELSNDPAEWIVHDVDGSGVTGWLFDTLNITDKFTRGGGGTRVLSGSPSSRFAADDALEAMLEPSAKLLKDIGQGWRCRRDWPAQPRQRERQAPHLSVSEPVLPLGPVRPSRSRRCRIHGLAAVAGQARTGELRAQGKVAGVTSTSAPPLPPFAAL